MLALGAAAAALAALVGMALSAQLVVAALIGGGAVAAWHLRRSRQPAAPPAAENRDVNLDIGERVHVLAWNADGSARVSYRGASWAVRYAGTDAPAPGAHVIAAVQGSELIVKRSG
jgi:membrane protein implicated in regulation of membrane protease activity